MAPNVEGKNHRLHRETINCKDSEFKWCVYLSGFCLLHQADTARCLQVCTCQAFAIADFFVAFRKRPRKRMATMMPIGYATMVL